jgi:excisionase family DNA binding protein
MSHDPMAESPDHRGGVTNDVLTVEELAEFLRVNHKTVREAIARGDIPGVRRIGTTIRISRDAVVNWMNSGQGRVSHSRRSR